MNNFWMYWALGIAALGALGLFWLVFGVMRARRAAPPAEVWDEDLREGNDEPPRFWFLSFFAALIFSCAYMMLYPGFGAETGLLGWSSEGQFAAGEKHYREKTAAVHKKWLGAPLSELRGDESAMKSARRLFASHCAACHGENARGQAGLFPDLTGGERQWGGSEKEIMQTLENGRTAAMPALRGLGKQQLEAVADYVLALNDGKIGKLAGREIYAANCAACHGARGEGNTLLGAPSFNNRKWTYRRKNQSARDAVMETVRNGRSGVMPAQKGRLHPEQIRILAAWLTGGMEKAPPLDNLR